MDVVIEICMDNLKYKIEKIDTPECIYFYAVKDNDYPIGCLEIIKISVKHYLLHKIFVLDNFRKNNIATNLINVFLENIDNNIEVTLQVIPDVYNFNEVDFLQKKLINFYSKFGFKCYDELETKIFKIPLMKYEKS